VQTNNLSKGLNKIQVKDAWFDIMGSGIKSYTQDVILNNKTLVVTLTSSIVKQELSGNAWSYFGSTKKECIDNT
jgi:hypothetical protein